MWRVSSRTSSLSIVLKLWPQPAGLLAGMESWANNELHWKEKSASTNPHISDVVHTGHFYVFDATMVCTLQEKPTENMLARKIAFQKSDQDFVVLVYRVGTSDNPSMGFPFAKGSSERQKLYYRSWDLLDNFWLSAMEGFQAFWW